METTTIRIRPAAERGAADFGWLDSRHTFSFGHYYDPEHMGFGALRVINDDRVQPGQGFGAHPHRDMEIVSIVIEGALEHKDSLGTGSVIRPGEVQRMSAGTGVVHSEFNPSQRDEVRFLQIWIEPDRTGLTPSYEQRAFPFADLRNNWALLASRDGRNGSLSIHQDVSLYRTQLTEGSSVEHSIDPGRRVWIQIIEGAATVNGQLLGEGDGAAIEEDGTVKIVGVGDWSDLLLFDLA
jgi:redox-sensitive bicupin YhaK (pirin superfamily)